MVASTKEVNKAFDELNEILVEAKLLVNKESYEQARVTVETLQQALVYLFSLDSFDRNIFIEDNIENLKNRALLLAIDDFLTSNVEKLTLTSQSLKTELAGLNVAKKMKKAYGKL
ncbi:hypothetical protein KO495_06375 [Colwellia sp. D2M02]|uniref:hypothetical protein n=1 Tax=Colwellia sp. D2M02 TaxID=2841562 RepID=UPI001C08C6B1|nr:hypothetical protein [Colwellia sp. D2M02]MBU2892949.1 hypothetical protein [Colwellia sp. D2M02]